MNPLVSHLILPFLSPEPGGKKSVHVRGVGIGFEQVTGHGDGFLDPGLFFQAERRVQFIILAFGKEVLDHFVVLLGLAGADCKDQNTPGANQVGGGVEQLFLLAGQALDVAEAALPFGVRVATHDA